MSNLRRPLTDASASDDAPAADAAATAFAAIQLNDFNELDDDEAEVRRRAYEMERRADEQWRSMHKEQRRRNEEAELKARPSAEQVASQAESRRQQALEQHARERQQRVLEESSSSSVARGDDEADASGWTPREQRGLQAALRTCPAKDFASAGGNARWQAVAAQLPGRSAKECLQRCKQLAAAVKAHRPSPLVRLEADVLLAATLCTQPATLCAQPATLCPACNPMCPGAPGGGRAARGARAARRLRTLHCRVRLQGAAIRRAGRGAVDA